KRICLDAISGALDDIAHLVEDGGHAVEQARVTLRDQDAGRTGGAERCRDLAGDVVDHLSQCVELAGVLPDEPESDAGEPTEPRRRLGLEAVYCPRAEVNQLVVREGDAELDHVANGQELIRAHVDAVTADIARQAHRATPDQLEMNW